VQVTPLARPVGWGDLETWWRAATCAGSDACQRRT